MFIVNIPREALIQLLPKEGIGLEIGVALGDFSTSRLKATQPQKPHLVDPWEFQERDDYRADPNNVPTTEGDKRHAAILTRFNNETSAGTIQVHRKFSDAAIGDFDANYFDWIYVDSIHTYDGVRNDLELYFPLVRDGGFILGHDFTNRDGVRK